MGIFSPPSGLGDGLGEILETVSHSKTDVFLILVRLHISASPDLPSDDVISEWPQN